MKVLNLYNKDEWEEGPWQTECDYVSWIDYETSYPCVMKRNIMGAWVGYVGIDEKHPLYMVPTTDTQFTYIEAHLGPCTYASFNTEESLQFAPPKKHWWIGFDCMQDEDYCPLTSSKTGRKKRKPRMDDGVYRDFAYVKDEVEGLAMQISTYDSRTYINDFDDNIK